MGLVLVFFLVIVPIIILSIGGAIGYAMGRRSGRKSSNVQPGQTELAKAWDAGYQAGHKDATQRAPELPMVGDQPSYIPDQQQLPLQLPEVPKLGELTHTQEPQSQPVPTAAVTLPPPAAPQLTPEELAEQDYKRKVRNANFTVYLSSVLLVAAGFLFISLALPVVLRIVLLAIATGGFYTAGLLLHRSSATLKTAGIAFTGTALALYPVLAFATSVLVFEEAALPWFFFSILGTVGFSVAAALLNSRIIAYLTIPFIISSGVAAGASLRSGMIWSFIFTIVVAAILSWFASEKPQWLSNIFVRAFVHTHEYLVPATLAALLMVYPVISDGQTLMVLAAALIYYISRTLLSHGKSKLWYFTASRAIALLAAFQALKAMYIATTTSQLIISVLLTATLIAVSAGQHQYRQFMVAHGWGEQSIRKWLTTDLVVHAVILGSTIASAEFSRPHLIGIGDWRSWNLPLVIGLLGTMAAIIILHRQKPLPASLPWFLRSPLSLMIIPFWLVVGGNIGQTAAWFRAEIVWLLALALLYAIQRSGQKNNQKFSQAVHTAVTLVLGVVMMIAAYYTVAAHTAVTGSLTEAWFATAIALGVWAAIIAAVAVSTFQLERNNAVIGYAFAIGALFLLLFNNSWALAQNLKTADQSNNVVLIFGVLYIAVILSLGLNICISIAQRPTVKSHQWVLLGFVAVSVPVTVQQEIFSSELVPVGTSWIPWVTGFVLAGLLYAASRIQRAQQQPQFQHLAHWGNSLAAIGAGFSVAMALDAFEAPQDLVMLAPIVVMVAYFVYRYLRPMNPELTGQSFSWNIRLSFALLLIVATLTLIIQNFMSGFSSDLHRYILVLAWLAVALAAGWRVFQKQLLYLIIAVIALYGAIDTAHLHTRMASETDSTALITSTTAAWLVLVIGVLCLGLEVMRVFSQQWRQNWGPSARWFIGLAIVSAVLVVPTFRSSGYVVAVAILLLAATMVIRSYLKPEGFLRPAAVPILYFAAGIFSTEFTSWVWSISADRLPQWLTIGFTASACGYLIGAFATGGHQGAVWARWTRLVSLGMFFVASLIGWTDTRASLVLAVALSVLTILALIPDIPRKARSWVFDAALAVAVVGMQQIYLDWNYVVLAQQNFWFPQHYAIVVAAMAALSWFRTKKRGHAAQPERRMMVYAYIAASLVTYGSLVVFFQFGTDALQVTWLLTAYVLITIFGSIKGKIGWIIWGGAGIIISLLSFFDYTGFLIVFVLAAALMSVGITKLVKLSKERQEDSPPLPPSDVTNNR